jgi:hypothetical protein
MALGPESTETSAPHQEPAMTLSMYQASVPVFLQGLKNLAAVLDKGAAAAPDHGLEASALLQQRLAPDMFPLVRQVQIASDHAKGAVARLAGIEVPKFEDAETSIEELKQRLSRVRDFILGVEASRIDGSEERDVVLRIGGQDMTFKGQTYLLYFALPNFYFHLTTAYAILRHSGIPLGKRDFIGAAP